MRKGSTKNTEKKPKILCRSWYSVDICPLLKTAGWLLYVPYFGFFFSVFCGSFSQGDLFHISIFLISRCSKVGGSLGNGVEEVFSHTIMDKYGHTSKTSHFSDKKMYKNLSFFTRMNICSRDTIQDIWLSEYWPWQFLRLAKIKIWIIIAFMNQ
jgi:hypothetical protein